jgi:hypothetical protein
MIEVIPKRERVPPELSKEYEFLRGRLSNVFEECDALKRAIRAKKQSEFLKLVPHLPRNSISPSPRKSENSNPVQSISSIVAEQSTSISIPKRSSSLFSLEDLMEDVNRISSNGTSQETLGVPSSSSKELPNGVVIRRPPARNAQAESPSYFKSVQEKVMCLDCSHLDCFEICRSLIVLPVNWFD